MKKYESIARLIEQQISAGKWTAGQRLPSIRQFAMRCKSSTYPVVQAMQELENRGCIVRMAGRGYTVSLEKRRRVMLLSSVREGAIEHYYDIFRKEAAKAQVKTQVIVVPDRVSWRKVLAQVRRWAPDSVLLDVEGLIIPFRYVRTLLKIVPVIFCNRFEWPDVSMEGLTGVLFDQSLLLSAQFDYLRKHGCRRIRYVPTQDEIQPFLKKHLEKLAEAKGFLWGSDAFSIASKLFYFSPHWRNRASHTLPDGLMGNDVSVFTFQQILETVFGPHPDIVKIGSMDSIWAHVAGHEFDSYSTPFSAIWQRALSGEVKTIEYVQPELHSHHAKGKSSLDIENAVCSFTDDSVMFRWKVPFARTTCVLWLSRTQNFDDAVMAGCTDKQKIELPLRNISKYSFWRIAAVVPDGRNAYSDVQKLR